MLRKLLKYDLKDIYKVLIIFYILSLFFAATTRIMFEFSNSVVMNVISSILSGVTISMIFNIIVNNIMRMWANFRRNFYGDESYLTHTLPLKKSELYLSKTLSAAISLLLSTAVIILTLLLAYGNKENFEFLKQTFTPLESSLGNDFYFILAAVCLIIFLELLNAMQCGFSGIILGHKMGGGKIGFSVLFGFIYYSASQIFVLLITFIAGLFDSDFMKLFTSNELSSLSLIKSIIYLALTAYFMAVIITYFINLKLFKKGVNVD